MTLIDMDGAWVGSEAGSHVNSIGLMDTLLWVHSNDCQQAVTV